MSTPIVQDLIAEFTDAFASGDFMRPIRTPGYTSSPTYEVGYVLAEDFCYSPGRYMSKPTEAVFALLRDLYLQHDPRAVAAIQMFAAMHAERHADSIEVDEDAYRDHFAEMQASDDRCGVAL